MGLTAILPAPQSEVLQKMLQKRGRIYYFRWVIPTDLRQILNATALVKSLRTGNEWEARRRSVPYFDKIRAIQLLRTRYLMGYLTEEDYESEVRKAWLLADFYITAFKEYEFASEQDHSAIFSGFEGILSLFKKGRKGINVRETIDGEDYDLITDIDRLIVSSIFENMTLEELDNEDRSILKKIRKVWLESHAYAAQQMKYEMDLDSPIVPPDFYTEALAEGDAGAEVDRNPLFSEVYSHFLDFKIKNANLSQRIQKEYQRYYDDWLSLAGDKPVDNYRKMDVKSFLITVSQLPKRNLKEYRGIPVTELCEMEIPDEHIVAPKTAGHYQKWLQGLFSYAVENEYIVESPARNLKLNLNQATRYATYSNSEVSTILERARTEKTKWHYWIVLLGAYTGMRLGEISNLVSDAIKIDEDSGVNYIHVSPRYGATVKTDASVRQVPIHQTLLEEGFLEFAKAANGPLFGVETRTMTQWFGAFREACGIERYDDFDQRKAFHSFRHTVITKARGNGVDTALVQRVVGHELSGSGLTDNYTHDFSIAQLKKVIDVIDYGT